MKNILLSLFTLFLFYSCDNDDIEIQFLNSDSMHSIVSSSEIESIKNYIYLTSRPLKSFLYLI